jgi:hypothetical protein
VAANNVIYDASKGGFTLFQGDGAAASHDNLIVNNTVYDPSGSRAAIQVAAGANNNVVFDNIFISKAAAFEIQSVTGLMHDYNIVSGWDGARPRRRIDAGERGLVVRRRGHREPAARVRQRGDRQGRRQLRGPRRASHRRAERRPAGRGR